MRNLQPKLKRLLTAALILAVAVCFTFCPELWSSAERTAHAETETESESKIADGTYVPSSFSFTGGTGKVKITCSWVKITDGKAEAEIVFHSSYYNSMTIGDKTYTPKVSESAGTASFTVPVNLNAATVVHAVTTRMSEAHSIEYTLHVGLKGKLKTYNSKSSNSGKKNSSSDSGKKNSGNFDYDKAIKKTSSAKDKKREKSYFKNGKLKDGTYRVQAWTDHYMFNIQPYKGGTYAILKVKNGKMKAQLTLTGQGYDYVYPGTKAQAEKAPKSKWCHYKEHNNYYSYIFPVKKLNKKFALAGHSKRENRWYAHTAKIYTAGIRKVASSATNIPKGRNTTKRRSSTAGTTTQKVFRNNHKKDRVSKSTKDTSGSTSKVNSHAGLRDGVYTPSTFSWSGGSGRLKGISCNKITVTNGKAYATIVFQSPHYDYLRADGRTFTGKQGADTSTFVIPVKLNANNTVVGRTTVMSQPHWITYTLYIGLTGKSGSSSSSSSQQLKGGQKKLSKKAPVIAGLKSKSEIKAENAKLFRIFQYNHGVVLVQVDMEKNTSTRKAVGYKEKKTKVTEDRDEIEQKEGKTQSERTQELYKGNVINYLIVPKGASIPAGLDKACVIIRTPKKGYTASQSALRFAGILNQSGKFTSLGFSRQKAYSSLSASQEQEMRVRVKNGKIQFPGKWKNVNYRDLVESQADLCILPSGALPHEIKNLNAAASGSGSSSSASASSIAKEHPVKHFFASIIGILPEKMLVKSLRSFVETYAPSSHAASGKGSRQMTEKEKAQKQYRQLDKTVQLFTAMQTPVLIDRSAREKTKLAKAEWIKVYGAIFGCEDDAQSWYSSYEKAQQE